MALNINNIIAAIVMAFSFLTVLPMPQIEWTASRLRFFPLALPLVGLFVGLFGTVLLWLLSGWRVSATLRAVLATLFYLCVTGGLHMDGLMDTCDAVFSRRDRKTRLAILADTRVGAFAVMGCASVLLLKVGAFSGFFDPAGPEKTRFPLFLSALVPVYSRTGLGLLFYLPFAREDGLVRMLGGARVFKDRYLLFVLYGLLGLPFLASPGCWVVPLAGASFALAWSLYCRETFGGLTGDLMGACLELSETLMFLTLVVAG
jgi:adenosylcobinamide-GDP ribazoletransferase